MTAATYSPRYREIETALRERIATLRPGQRLPSDADLCTEFGVSRMTARHAMAQLAEEGLVRRVSRARHLRGRAPDTSSGQLPDDVLTRDAAPGPRAHVAHHPPHAAPAVRTGARRSARGAGEDVVELCRVRLADGVPVALETAVLAPRCAAAVLLADLESGSLHEALISAASCPRGARPPSAPRPPAGKTQLGSGCVRENRCSSSGASSSISEVGRWNERNRAMRRHATD